MKFYLIDYKGKFDIICDDICDEELEVGTITKEQAIKDKDWRKESATYYGVPAYIGKDEELNKIYN
jgi:hypothetical protein